MSFVVKLQENVSPSNFVHKEITDIATATGTLREGTSIIDPQILIESQLDSDILGRVNYAYIQDFHRYYYINNIELDINGLWLFDMNVDVLMSYETQIRNQKAIVARQYEKYNMYLDDGWFMAYQNPEILVQHFLNSSGQVVHPFNHEEFVLVVAGGFA